LTYNNVHHIRKDGQSIITYGRHTPSVRST
jgi:hypothetical protein